MAKKISLLALAALVWSLTGCFRNNETSDNGSDNHTDNQNNISQIYVKSEFSPLKKVVLAESQIILPEKLDASILKILNPEALAMDQSAAGKDFKDTFSEIQKQWEEERENLKKVLEKYGVKVLRPRLLTEYEKKLGGTDGCSNFFARDPFFTIGNIIIEGSLRYKHRRNEILPLRSILEKAASESGAIYVSVPRPDISEGPDSEMGPFLEGGDVLILDKTVFVGISGQASNEKGYQWLKEFLAHYGYEVIKVPLRNEVLHLDCALSLVKPGLMIVSKDAFTEGIPEKLKSWDKISVPASDIAYLAVNGLPINEETYILDPKFEYIGKALETRGIKTEYIDFQISRTFGGSFRCSTQALFR